MNHFTKAVTWLSCHPKLRWLVLFIIGVFVALWESWLTIAEWTFRGIGIALGMTIFFRHYPQLLALFH